MVLALVNFGCGGGGDVVSGGSDDPGVSGDDFASAEECPIGTPVARAIDSDDDEDFFVFTATEDGLLTLETTGPGATIGKLYDAMEILLWEGGPMSMDNLNFSFEAPVTAGETYYITVSAFCNNGACSTGAYILELSYSETYTDDHGSCFSAASPLTVGIDMDGEIEVFGDRDYFSVTVDAEALVSFATSGDTDTFGFLYDENGDYLCYDYDSGTNSNFSFQCALFPGNTYYLVVEKQMDATPNAYTIETSTAAITDDYGNLFSNASDLLTVGTPLDGELNYSRDEDMFVFTVSVSGVYEMGTTSSIDTYGTLYGSDRDELSRDDDSGPDYNFYLPYELVEGETYYLKVRGYGPGTLGAYSVFLNKLEDDDHGNSMGTASPLIEGTSVDGVIDNATDSDYFVFTPATTAVYRFQTTSSSETYCYLYDSENEYLASQYGSTGLTAELQAGETYYLEVTSSDVGTSYTLLAEQVTNDDFGNSFDTAGSLTPGTPLEASLEYVEDLDFFLFTAPESGTYVIKSDGTTDTAADLFREYLRLSLAYDYDSGDGGNFQIVYDLEAGKSYYLSVNGQNNEVGDYTLFVFLVQDDFSSAVPLTPGTPADGRIELPYGSNFYLFTAPTSDLYVIETTGSTDTTGTLYDADSRALDIDDQSGEGDNFMILYDLTAGQTYFVEVSGYEIATGDYTLSVHLPVDDYGDDFSSAASLTPGTPTDGRIEIPHDGDFFVFTAPTNDTYEIGTTGSTDTTGTLYDSNYAFLFTDDYSGDGDNFQIYYSLISGQTYYIEVSGTDTSVGSYTLTVDSTVDDYGNDFITSAPLTLGTPVDGEIEISGDYDYFNFTASADGTLVIGTSGTTDTYGYLYNAAEQELTNNDDGGSGTNFQITYDLAVGQLYYIAVRGYNISSTTGPYTLESSFTPTP